MLTYLISHLIGISILIKEKVGKFPNGSKITLALVNILSSLTGRIRHWYSISGYGLQNAVCVGLMWLLWRFICFRIILFQISFAHGFIHCGIVCRIVEALDNLIHTPLPASLINSSSEEGIELFNTVQPNLAFKVRIQSSM